jgi:hypothetical protein
MSKWRIGCSGGAQGTQCGVGGWVVVGQSMARCSRGLSVGYDASTGQGLRLKLAMRRTDDGEAEAHWCGDGAAALRWGRCFSDSLGSTLGAR